MKLLIVEDEPSLREIIRREKPDGLLSTLGGQGILFGTVIGAAIWAVLQNGLQFAGAPVAIRNIAIGIIVIISVLIDIIVRGRAPKKGAHKKSK